MSRVYIVAAGERDEGHSPVAAYDSLFRAKADVIERGGIPPLIKVDAVRWWTVKPDGVDELWIYSMPVRGGDPR